MPIVQMPDGQKVELPDNPTPEQLAQIESLMSSPVKEGFKEVGRVADKVVRKGGAALPGFMGDLGLTALRNNDRIGGQTGIMGMPSMLMRGLGLTNSQPYADTQFGDVTKAVETVGGALPPVAEPVTSGGKAVANTLEPVLSAIMGGGAGTWGQKAVQGMAAGGGGEAATRLLGEDNALVRFLGALTGGGLAGVAQAYKPNSQQIIKTATEQMTDLDWKKAEAKKKVLEAHNMPHLNSQLLGPRSTLDDVVHSASTNPKVKPRLETAVPEDKVKSKAQQALGDFSTRNVTIPSKLGERRDVLSDVQGAAQQTLDNIRTKANNAYVSKMPPEGEHYDKDHILSLRQQLLDLADSDRFGRGTAGGSFIRGVAERLMQGRDQLDDLAGQAVSEPITSKHIVNNIIKELNQAAEKEGYKGLALDDVKKLMKGFTPEFDDARSAKTAVMNRDYNPTAKGLVGDLANQGGGVRPDKTTAREGGLAIVFPKNTPQPQAILELEKRMGGDSVGQLLREHLAREMEAATGMQGRGPHAFVTAIAGTNAQRQNLNAALEATARANGVDPGPVRKGFYKLMKAFDSYKDLKISGEIDRAALQQEAGKNLPSWVVAPQSRPARWFWEKATAKTFNEITDIILSKDGLEKLRAIAQSPSPELARQTVMGIMATTMQSVPEPAVPQSPGNMP
jgi:hypothetical protein